MIADHIDTVVNEMGNGCTRPLSCILDNGNYIVFKTYDNEQGNITLVNELVSCLIAQRLKLSMPGFGIAKIDKNTHIQISDAEFPIGLGFYSNRIEKATTEISQELLHNYCSNKEELLRIIVFDHLIYNKDRNPGNIIFSMKDKKIYIIDHTHCFNLECLWDKIQLNHCMKREDFRDTSIMESNYSMYNKFISILHLSLSELLDIAKDFESTLNKEFFLEVIQQIPKEWGISHEDLIALADYLTYRLANLPGICEMIFKYIRKGGEA